MSQSNVQSLFGLVNIYRSTFDHPELRQKLTDYLETEKAKGHSVQVSNRGGFQTEDLCPGKLASEFVHGLRDEIGSYMKSFKIRRYFRVNITGLWVNSNHQYHFNLPHAHSPDFFSGVWYLKVPENSGDICFLNPIFGNTFNYHHFFGDDCFHDTATYACSDNFLIMFPSYMQHMVFPNQSGEERISVAFNFGLVA